MEMQQHRSGLMVPKKKPAKPERQYGPLEIRDPEARETAKAALLGLWDAMELSHPGGILSPNSCPHEAYRALYWYVGEILLGRDDCPEKEVLT